MSEDDAARLRTELVLLRDELVSVRVAADSYKSAYGTLAQRADLLEARLVRAERALTAFHKKAEPPHGQ